MAVINWIFLIYLSFLQVTKASYIVLTNSIPKCLVIDGSPETIFDIFYDSPDIISIPHDDSDRIGRRPKDMMKESQRGAWNRILDDTDSIHNGKPKHNEKNNNIGNIHIMVSELRQEEDNIHFGWNDPSNQSNLVTTELTTTSGKIRYEMHSLDNARICIQSLGATNLKPTFISLRVKEVFPIDVQHEKEEKEENAKDDKQKKIVLNHWDFLERELLKLIEEVKRLSDATRHSKQLHMELKSSLLKMITKHKWIKIFRIFVTLMIATMYVKALLRYLKRRKIIY